MKILLANANTTEAITALCAATGRLAASPGTEIIPVTPRFGPAVISSRLENAIAAHGLLDALAPHARQVDGVLLAVSLDTALDAARQLMPCPVLGMTEAALLVACTQGARFGLLTMGGTETYAELIARHGLSGRLAGLAGIASTPQDAVRDPEGVVTELLAEVARLVAMGAESIVLGGAALAGLVPRLQPRAPVALIDGIASGVRLLEAIIGLQLPRPAAGSHRAVQGRDSLGLSAPLAMLLKA